MSDDECKCGHTKDQHGSDWICVAVDITPYGAEYPCLCIQFREDHS